MLMESFTVEEKQLDFNRPLISIRRPTQTSEPETKTRTNNKKIPTPPSPPVYKSDIKSGPVRIPGTVPFQWEHKPGKPKDETKPSLKPQIVPKLPPGRVVEKKKTENREDSCEDDANDTVSRSESFSFNCSSVSGLDGSGLLVDRFGSLSSDKQTQDLMMGRFLPAAKALSSETPKKPPKPEKRLSQLKQGKQSKVPLRSSLGLLNPDQRPVSVRRMRSKYQDSTTCNDKQIVNEDKEKVESSSEVSQNRISRNFGELLASDDNIYEEEAHVVEKTLYVDIVHLVDKKVQEETEKQSLDVVVGYVKEDQDLNGSGEEAVVALQESNVVVEVAKEKIDLELRFQRAPTTNLERLIQRSRYDIVPTPPLPKAPSDSWLKRTLPTIPPKNNSFTWLQSLGTDDNNNTKIQENLKWETMVKTSNTQQGFVCFSKETLNPIPEA